MSSPRPAKRARRSSLQAASTRSDPGSNHSGSPAASQSPTRSHSPTSSHPSSASDPPPVVLPERYALYKPEDKQFYHELKTITDNFHSDIDEAYDERKRPQDFGEEVSSELYGAINAITRRCTRFGSAYNLEIGFEALVRVAEVAMLQEGGAIPQMWDALEALVQGIKEVAEMMRMDGQDRTNLRAGLKELNKDWVAYKDLNLFQDLSEELEAEDASCDEESDEEDEDENEDEDEDEDEDEEDDEDET
ncbi:uncharacterized protein MKK02DRAFT_39735 [Dioszegia hungarica]|uniref:Uncharacterized protein n=1 Tax=Dioszegia hungarica TaxID=4972 RepID=A0AA38HFV4_9TREE|nr:uncharacterized protein MKK02DRAFT_39735 [Dioszegia hungarica]KAI9639438.1 hypothetical protein MKK02DRAFT_39735 [Dioszegia hungarica]